MKPLILLLLVIGYTLCAKFDEITLTKASQSSIYSDLYNSHNAIDKDNGTQAPTKFEDDPWLRVYFNSSNVPVAKVAIELGHNYDDACIYRVSVYEGDKKKVCGTYNIKYGYYYDEVVECGGLHGDSVLLEMESCLTILNVYEIRVYQKAYCSAGSYMTDTGCSECPEGTWSSANATSCTDCDQGMVSEAGSESCYYVELTLTLTRGEYNEMIRDGYFNGIAFRYKYRGGKYLINLTPEQASVYYGNIKENEDKVKLSLSTADYLVAVESGYFDGIVYRWYKYDDVYTIYLTQEQNKIYTSNKEGVEGLTLTLTRDEYNEMVRDGYFNGISFKYTYKGGKYFIKLSPEQATVYNNNRKENEDKVKLSLTTAEYLSAVESGLFDGINYRWYKYGDIYTIYLTQDQNKIYSDNKRKNEEGGSDGGLTLSLTRDQYNEMVRDGYFNGISFKYTYRGGKYLINLSPEQATVYNNNIKENEDKVKLSLSTADYLSAVESGLFDGIVYRWSKYGDIYTIYLTQEQSKIYNDNKRKNEEGVEGLTLTLTRDEYNEMVRDGYFNGISFKYTYKGGKYFIKLSPEQATVYNNNRKENEDKVKLSLSSAEYLSAVESGLFDGIVYRWNKYGDIYTIYLTQEQNKIYTSNKNKGSESDDGLTLSLTRDQYDDIIRDGYFNGISIKYTYRGGKYLIYLSPEQATVYNNNRKENEDKVKVSLSSAEYLSAVESGLFDGIVYRWNKYGDIYTIYLTQEQNKIYTSNKNKEDTDDVDAVTDKEGSEEGLSLTLTREQYVEMMIDGYFSGIPVKYAYKGGYYLIYLTPEQATLYYNNIKENKDKIKVSLSTSEYQKAVKSGLFNGIIFRWYKYDDIYTIYLTEEQFKIYNDNKSKNKEESLRKIKLSLSSEEYLRAVELGRFEGITYDGIHTITMTEDEYKRYKNKD